MPHVYPIYKEYNFAEIFHYVFSFICVLRICLLCTINQTILCQPCFPGYSLTFEDNSFTVFCMKDKVNALDTRDIRDAGQAVLSCLYLVTEMRSF